MKNIFFVLLTFLGLNSFAQIIAIQSFEGGSDTWGPTVLSTPACTNGADRWDFSTVLHAINPSDGSVFWGIEDLNGNCGGTGFESITLPNIDVSACASVNFSFDYNAFEFDAGDDIKYELFYDNVSQGEVVVVNGDANLSTAGWETETVAIPGAVTNVSVVISVKQNGGGDHGGIDNIILDGVGCVACGGPVAEPTNEVTGAVVSNIACTTADLDWINGAGSVNTLVVVSTNAIAGNPIDGTAYNANANFGSGSTIAAGEFVVYNGAGGDVSITGLAEGVNYFVKIFEYNGATANCEENYLTGGVTVAFTTLTGCVVNTPWVQTILYDSCNGTSEGTDEIVTFITGSNALDIDLMTFEYPSGGDYCNSGCGTQTNVNNPTYVNDLNTLAGCTVFAYVNPIPANSTVMVFTGNPPTTVLDYSSQCGNPDLPIYVIFNDNSSSIGRFSNSNVRDLTVDFGDGTTQTVTYDGGSLNGDGSSALFDESGNVSYFSSNDCIFPLPVELISFNAFDKDSDVSLKWTTASETNNDYFVVEKSVNGQDYFEIGKVDGNGNSSTKSDYSFRDTDPSQGIVYYRLKQIDFDGGENYSIVVKLNRSEVGVYYFDNAIFCHWNNQPNKSYSVNVYNLSGQIVESYNVNSDSKIEWNQKGLFILEIPELQYKQKISCY